MDLITSTVYFSTGSVKFETVIHSDIRGRVDIEPIANAWPKYIFSTLAVINPNF